MAENIQRCNLNNDCAEGLSGNQLRLTREEEVFEGPRRIQENGDVDYDSVVKSLTKLANKTGMPIFQQTGQRIFGPPMDYEGTYPPNSAEVFIGHLPKDCFEPELIPILEKVGRIFQMRLMMDYNHTTRGFCFVQYFENFEAEKAVRELNNWEIRKGWRMTVVPSTSKKTLFLRNLPWTKTPRDISFLMTKLAKGVVAVTVPKPRSHQRGYRNRGYCFVEFDSHESALHLLTRWCKKQVKVFTDEVTIQWADMVPQPNSIIVYDLAPTTTNEKIISIFNEVSHNGVDHIEKRVDGVYIFFKTIDQAQTAKNALNYRNIDGAIIKIKMNTVNASDQRTNQADENQFQEELGSTVSTSEDFNFENQNNEPEPTNINNNITTQTYPVPLSNNAVPLCVPPNQVQPWLNANNQPSLFFPMNPPISTQGIHLYGPYYPPPVYMLPIQFANGLPYQ